MVSPDHNGKCYSYRLRLRRAGDLAAAPGPGLMRQVFFVQRGGSWGEASPSAMCGETAAETGRALERILEALASAPQEATPAELSAWLKERFPLAPAARAAVEMAAFDAAAREQGLPLHQYLHLPSPAGVASSWRLTLTSEEGLEARLEEARAFPSLKIHCSGHAERDLELIKWIAQHTSQPLRINVRGSWTPAEARAFLPGLGRLSIEYIEQPLPRHMVEETAGLMRLSPVPLLLDEDACATVDLKHIATACNGFVIKVMTSGGLTEAMRMIRQGRALGLHIALDTTAESSLAATAAAHLAGAVDYVDLTAPLLLENDPFEGITFEAGRLQLPAGPGTAARLRTAYRDWFHHPYGH